MHLERKGVKIMFEEKLSSTRSIARKLAREILPEEMSEVAAGTITLSGADHLPGDIDQGASLRSLGKYLCGCAPEKDSGAHC